MAESAPTCNDFIDIPVAHLVTEDEFERVDAERERRLALEERLRELGELP